MSDDFVHLPTTDEEWASTHAIEQWLRPPREVVLDRRFQRRLFNHNRKEKARKKERELASHLASLRKHVMSLHPML